MSSVATFPSLPARRRVWLRWETRDPSRKLDLLHSIRVVSCLQPCCSKGRKAYAALHLQEPELEALSGKSL
jgi:hypothetical protein